MFKEEVLILRYLSLFLSVRCCCLVLSQTFYIKANLETKKYHDVCGERK